MTKKSQERSYVAGFSRIACVCTYKSVPPTTIGGAKTGEPALGTSSSFLQTIERIREAKHKMLKPLYK